MDDPKDFFSYAKGETYAWWVDGYGKTPSEKTLQFIFLKALLHLENIRKSNFVISPQIGV